MRNSITGYILKIRRRPPCPSSGFPALPLSHTLSPAMNVLRFTDPAFSARVRQLTAESSLLDKSIEERTRAILEAVYIRGDAALLEFTERFDGATLNAEQLPVTKAELVYASLKADQPLRQAIAVSANNIEMFSRKSLRKNWSAKNAQ